MSGPLRRIPRAIHEAMIERAEADYPEETCGFVFGAGDALEVLPMKNIQNDLHARDPDGYPRDARIAYEFDPAEMVRVLSEKERAGIPLRAIYHSHPDQDAYFSSTDSTAASPFGEPSYPGAVYLVYSVRSARVVDCKGFDWSTSDNAYAEVPLEVVDDLD